MSLLTLSRSDTERNPHEERHGTGHRLSANQKGGVAKTTTTLNLAVAFREMGHRVLAVDLDPQGNLTRARGWIQTRSSARCSTCSSARCRSRT